MDLVVMVSLENIHTIEVGSQTEFFEGNFSFVWKLETPANNIVDLMSDFGIVDGKIGIIYLATEESFGAINKSMVDVLFMDGVLETKIRAVLEYTGNMVFPKSTCLRVALQSTLDRDNHRPINGGTKLGRPPIGEGIINTQIARSRGARGMCVSILGVASEHQLVLGGCQSTLETEDGHLNAGGIGVEDRVKVRDSARRPIAAFSGTTRPIGFDFVIPMGTENNCTRRGAARCTIHTQGPKLINLLVLASLPEWPSVKRLKLTTSKRTQSLFGCRQFVGRDRLDSKVHILDGGEDKIRERGVGTESMDGKQFVEGKGGCSIIVVKNKWIGIEMVVQVQFP